jgi:hypothetical protein
MKAYLSADRDCDTTGGVTRLFNWYPNNKTAVTLHNNIIPHSPCLPAELTYLCRSFEKQIWKLEI